MAASCLVSAYMVIVIAPTQNVHHRQQTDVTATGVGRQPTEGCSMDWGHSVVERLLVFSVFGLDLCLTMCTRTIDYW